MASILEPFEQATGIKLGAEPDVRLGSVEHERVPEEALRRLEARIMEIDELVGIRWTPYAGGEGRFAPLQCIPGQRGVLLLDFEKDAKVPVHRHLYSDRNIIVLEGKGWFHYYNNNNPGGFPTREEVTRRSLLRFSGRTYHTFETYSGLKTVSVHTPYVDIASPLFQTDYKHPAWR